jgi:hypothetical protein
MRKSTLKSIVKHVLREMIDVEKNGPYTFKDFGWMGNMAGFGVPSDVYVGSTYIGTIETTNDGANVYIVLVDTPEGKKRFKKDSPTNKFKSKNQAAEGLHRVWKIIRSNGVNETTQNDIKSRQPKSQEIWRSIWDNNPAWSKLTLDNIKSLRDKVARDQGKEDDMYKVFDDEIKRRLQYINKPV